MTFDANPVIDDYALHSHAAPHCAILGPPIRVRVRVRVRVGSLIGPFTCLGGHSEAANALSLSKTAPPLAVKALKNIQGL